MFALSFYILLSVFQSLSISSSGSLVLPFIQHVVNVPVLIPSCLSVMDLIYWKETERTGMVLTGLVVGLLCLFQLSIISVVSAASLALMCFTISVRIYYQVLYILNWGDGEHPFK